jgi:uncharacterized Zn finger protein
MQQQDFNLNISLDQTQALKCEKCDNQTFNQSFLLRKASRLLTGSPQDALIPIQVFACTKCGHVNNEFMPLQLKNQSQDDSVEIIEETTNDGSGKIIQF